MQTLWIHPFNGIAGDMTLGALIAAGVDVGHLRTELAKLNVDRWQLNAEPVSRNGIGAINVTVDADEGHVHRTAADIIELVTNAGYTDRVTNRAVAVFEALAEAEGHVHDMEPSKVHFHEVGGIDAIIDVVGSCLCLEALGVERIVVAPVAMGHGIAKSAHGIISNPAPATTRLLEGVPVKGLDVNIELTTPTGAALVRALADEYGPMPAMTITNSGFGAGDRELAAHPNLLHVILGEGSRQVIDQLIAIETNVDDLSAEYLAHAVTKLMEAGSLDAWLTPIEMKKGRHASMLSALVDPSQQERIGEVLLTETGSLGYRAYGVDRAAVSRRFGSVELEGQVIAIKVSNGTAKPEFADVEKAAEVLGRPARTIAAEAQRLWSDQALA